MAALALASGSLPARAAGIGAAAAAARTTTRVSVTPSGHTGDGESAFPAVSAHGRYVVFWSAAPDLEPGGTREAFQTHLRDRLIGRTTLVSVNLDGRPGDMNSYLVSVSGDGRFVAFMSQARDLVPDDTNEASDVFVRDMVAGSTTRASVSSREEQARPVFPNALTSNWPSLSADGSLLAFQSSATNLVPGDTNGVEEADTDIFVRDLRAGTTRRVSLGPNGRQANGTSYASAVSADGRYVAFVSDAPNLVAGDTNGALDVFLRDLRRGVTSRMSVSSGGRQANHGGAGQPSISADGRYVAFGASASNLVPGDTNGQEDVFVRDVRRGTTTRVSVGPGGRQANGPSGPGRTSLSADGRAVVFTSEASNLLVKDLSGGGDCYLHDLRTRITRRISTPVSARIAFSRNCKSPSISADGRHVAFDSDAGDIIPEGWNGWRQVYVRDDAGDRTASPPR
jgi:TolB protein